MAAEFDTQPDYRDDEDRPLQSEGEDERSDRGSSRSLLLAVLVALLVLFILSQCTARVPNTIGMAPSDAKQSLAKAGLEVGEICEVPVDTVKPGLVQAQAPLGGVIVRKGTSVDLMVALGDGLATVPDVVGQYAANAVVELQQAGFEADSGEEYSDSVPRGVSLAQSPLAGSMAKRGSTVTVYYSLGPHSAAEVAFAPSDTDDGIADTERGETGSGTGPFVINCTDAYPGATAWSSGGDIYVRLSRGGAARRVTSTSDWDTAPVISPSHKYLVFLRAPGPGQNSTGVGVVCFTSFGTYMLSMLPVTLREEPELWYGAPVFAPSPDTTRPDTDWIVFPQYWSEWAGEGKRRQSARLIVCNVPMDSKWVSWNLRFRPARTLTLGRSSKNGCVRVTQRDGGNTVYARDFNVTTGLYLR